MCGIGTEQHSQTATHSGRSVSLVSAQNILFPISKQSFSTITFESAPYIFPNADNERWSEQKVDEKNAAANSNALHQELL
jgi:hypothetical protein